MLIQIGTRYGADADCTHRRGQPRDSNSVRTPATQPGASIQLMQINEIGLPSL